MKRMLLITPELLDRFKKEEKDKVSRKILRRKGNDYKKWQNYKRSRKPYLKRAILSRRPVKIPIIDEEKQIESPSPKRKKKKSPTVVITPKRRALFRETHYTSLPDIQESDSSDEYVSPDRQREVLDYSSRHFGRIGGKYLSPYVHRRKSTDPIYGIRKEDEEFMIGNYKVDIDEASNLRIGDRIFRGTEGLWELLTRKRPDGNNIEQKDLDTYKEILLLTKGHLGPSGTIKSNRGHKYQNYIRRIFPPRWQTYK